MPESSQTNNNSALVEQLLFILRAFHTFCVRLCTRKLTRGKPCLASLVTVSAGIHEHHLTSVAVINGGKFVQESWVWSRGLRKTGERMSFLNYGRTLRNVYNVCMCYHATPV